MHGREHLVGIMVNGKGLMLEILRYPDELRRPETYFDKIDAKPKPDAVQHDQPYYEAGPFAGRTRQLAKPYAAKSAASMLR